MFSLAKELGMTVSRLANELTMEEIIGWSAYFALRDEEDKRERDKVQRGSASRTQSR
tara:strand:+ start:2265 stop:2435 length:171 start_codon:yes stop_codon:yes gene_type:complete